MWRVHRSREAQGLPATNGNIGYQNHRQGENVQYNSTVAYHMYQLFTGSLEQQYLDAPFTRMHQSIQDYPSHLSDWDDVPMYQVDTFERMKPFAPLKEHVEGTTTVIPMDDNDSKLHFYDIQGESLYTNPPNPNYPTIDHGLEEDKVWAFKLTGYNQYYVNNAYSKDVMTAIRDNSLPFWALKLSTPAFWKPEKY